jgi:hypothetical protein
MLSQLQLLHMKENLVRHKILGIIIFLLYLFIALNVYKDTMARQEIKYKILLENIMIM